LAARFVANLTATASDYYKLLSVAGVAKPAAGNFACQSTLPDVYPI
jgi:hypothetical protein